MRQRRERSDEVLFISALAAVLLGVGLLLYTTGAFTGLARAWPVLVLAVGGVLLYLAILRGASSYIFFGGCLFALEGAFALVASLLGLGLREAWPLSMVMAGIAGLVAGARRWGRLRAAYAFPSLGFLFLGAVFSLFSFHLVAMSFGRFVSIWWPSLLIAGGVFLFAAYGLGRRPDPRRRGEADRDGPLPPRPGDREPGP